MEEKKSRTIELVDNETNEVTDVVELLKVEPETETIDIFSYIDITEEEKERVIEFIVDQEACENEDFMLYQKIVLKTCSRLFSMLDNKDYVLMEYQNICAGQERLIEDMQITEAIERDRLEKAFAEQKERIKDLEIKNEVVNANSEMLKDILVKIGIDGMKKEPEMTEDEARLAKYISDKADRQQVISTLKRCSKAEDLAAYIPTLRYDTDMLEDDMKTKEFREAIMPLLGYSTTDGALKAVIYRAFNKL